VSFTLSPSFPPSISLLCRRFSLLALLLLHIDTSRRLNPLVPFCRSTPQISSNSLLRPTFPPPSSPRYPPASSGLFGLYRSTRARISLFSLQAGSMAISSLFLGFVTLFHLQPKLQPNLHPSSHPLPKADSLPLPTQ